MPVRISARGRVHALGTPRPALLSGRQGARAACRCFFRSLLPRGAPPTLWNRPLPFPVPAASPAACATAPAPERARGARRGLRARARGQRAGGGGGPFGRRPAPAATALRATTRRESELSPVRAPPSSPPLGEKAAQSQVQFSGAVSGKMYFCLFLLASSMNYPGCYIQNKLKETLQGSGPETRHNGGLAGVSCVLFIPDLELKKLATQIGHQMQRKKGPTGAHSRAKGPGKGLLARSRSRQPAEEPAARPERGGPAGGADSRSARPRRGAGAGLACEQGGPGSPPWPPLTVRSGGAAWRELRWCSHPSSWPGGSVEAGKEPKLPALRCGNGDLPARCPRGTWARARRAVPRRRASPSPSRMASEEGRTVKITQLEQQGDKRLKKMNRDLWDSNKRPNICLLESQESRRKNMG